MVTTQLLLLLTLSSAGDTVLLDFSSRWCAPCRQMEPTIQRLTSAGFPVRKIDVDQNPQLAAQFRVTSVPCFVLVTKGREADRVLGVASYARLLQMFEAARAASPPPQLAATEQRDHQIRGQSPGRRLGALSFPDPRRLLGRNARAASTSIAPPSDPLAANRDSVSGKAPVDRTIIDRSLAATVRLKVDDPDGRSFGTGTIIDAHGTEALVVTCGHIFRDSRGQGHIQVDLFAGAAPRTVPGVLISYDLQRDIALVSIVPGVSLNPVSVAPAGIAFRPGDSVFSIGCDHGADPTVRESRIASVDKYLGPPNIEVDDEPVNGRSGGGLFTADGLLIGICNLADPADHEGIYASLPSIHWELDRIGQRRVYAGNPNLGESSSTRNAADIADARGRPAASGSPVGFGETAVPADRIGDTEVICILRSRTDPRGGERLLILDRPSQELLDRLARESRSNDTLAARRSRPNPSSRFSGEAVIRAQSTDR